MYFLTNRFKKIMKMVHTKSKVIFLYLSVLTAVLNIFTIAKVIIVNLMKTTNKQQTLSVA